MSDQPTLPGFDNPPSSGPAQPSSARSAPGAAAKPPDGTACGEAARDRSPLEDPAAVRRIVAGLEAEWRIAVQRLPGELARRMRPPGFAISDTQRLLGQWVGPPVREIRLAGRLFLEHPWYAAVDVLLHETAHQVAQEVLGAHGETEHGETFRDACALLGANPAASGTYPTADEAALSDEQREDETGRVMERVRKLLALAESPNRHEAERAMAKAHQLMARHNLSVIQNDLPRDFHSVCIGKPGLRHSLDVHVLATLLRDFYFVKVIWIPTYVLEKGKTGRVLEISGTKSNVQLAHYVHDYVQHYIEREWRSCRVRGASRNGRRDFALGVLRGFRDVLERQASGPEEQALVRMGDPQLDVYFSSRHPNRRTTSRGRGVRVDPDVVDAGEDAGRRLVIRKGVTDPARQRRRQLGQ